MIITPLNNQKPEASSFEQSEIEHIEMFPTIQGEGPFSGLPAIFLRLAGCNIKCPACDTQYTEGRTRAEIRTVAGTLNEMARNHPCKPLLVVTGGEPFRQGPALWSMMELIDTKSFNGIQIETNGTLGWRSSDVGMVTAEMLERSGVNIVVSPKAGVAGWFYSLQTQQGWPRVSVQITWKYVLSFGQIDPVDGLPLHVLGRSQRPGRPAEVPPRRIYIQPADLKDEELNKLNLAACVESSMRFGYRLSLQVHKLAGLA